MLGKKSSRKPIRNPRMDVQRSQPVFSYRSARSGADRQFERGIKPNSKTNSIKRRLKHIPFFLSFIAIVAALLYNLTLIPSAQIIVLGEQTMLRPKESYETTINTTLKNSPLNRTKITINTKRLSAEIKRQFPEIESLDISLPLLRHQPVVRVVLATPAALLNTPNESYVLDGNGRTLFTKNSADPNFDSSELPVIDDPSGHKIEPGLPALTRQQITFAQELQRHAESKELNLETSTLAAGGEELHMRFSGLAYSVKFSFAANARQSFGAFLATKERVERDGVPISEYIDVRIPERAYIK